MGSLRTAFKYKMLLVSQNNVYQKKNSWPKTILSHAVLIETNVPVTRNFEGDNVAIGVYCHIL